MSTPLIEHSAGDATEVELKQTYRRLRAGNIYAFEKSYLQRL